MRNQQSTVLVLTVPHAVMSPYQGVAVATGIFTLTAMSVDRYMSIQRPSHAQWHSSLRSAAIITAFVWSASAAFMSPHLYVRTVDTVELERLPAMTFCIERWPRGTDRQVFGSLLLLVVYVIPVAIVAVCYANVGRLLCSYTIPRDNSGSTGTYIYCRRRAARALFLLVGLFIVCWLPYNVTSLLVDLGLGGGLVASLPFTLWLGHAHSAVNPVLYWATNRQFRHVAFKVFKTLRCPGNDAKNRPRNWRPPRQV
ncbi:neuropeptide y receptor-like [Plakobranchus ocellatus]|uniref:Neuropeptide y receptor-like n=1 Tax=Plakobranchus ocellatus TaxID=259542 RepID=A0AAV4AU26_9GAST|nr:neuropeptide y receptor-like [Plakobranchus ocellatus]